ncbi:hypothetical protein C8F01DRAFT_470207 [Mycena amicta]|nr:hypothetical protein C8F01DRAFT_470207 [Mycena amicta]
MASSLHIPHNHQLRLLVNQAGRTAPSYGSEYASYASSSSTNWVSSSSSAAIFNRRYAYAGTAMDAYETSYDSDAIFSAPHRYPPLWHCTPCGLNFPSLLEHQNHRCPASQSLKRRRVDDDDEGDDEEQESVDETERPRQRRRVTTESTATRKSKTTAKTKSKPRPKKPVPVKKNNAAGTATVGTKGQAKAKAETETETETTPLPAPLRVTRSSAARVAKDPVQAP